MKICHFSTVHPALDTRIFIKQCQSLMKHGHEVVLVAQYEKDDKVDGIRIVALNKPGNRLRRMTTHQLDAYRKIMRENADAYHFHDPELIPLALFISLKGKKVIYDIHEDVREQILSKKWIPHALRPLISKLYSAIEKLSISHFKHLITVTDKIAKNYNKHKISVVHNYPIIGELVMNNPIPFSKRPNEVAYVGGISEIRGIVEFVDALGRLPDNIDLKLNLVGEFNNQALKEKVMKMKGWNRVVHHGFLNREEVRDVLSKSKAGIVIFHPIRNNIDGLPNKLFEYMSAGIPVIASDFPVWRQIITDANCGICTDPMNPEAIADSLIKLISDDEKTEELGKNGYQAVNETYNWNSEAKKLFKVYESL